MAIAAMKKVTIVAMKSERRRLLGRMQQLGCVEVSRPDDEALASYAGADSTALDESEMRLNRIDAAIKTLSRYDTAKKGMFAQRPVLDAAAADLARAEHNRMMETIARLEEMDRRLLEIRGQQARLSAQVAQWEPWRAFAAPLEQVKDTVHTRTMLGTVDKRQTEAFVQNATAIGALVEVISQAREGAYVFIAYHHSCTEEIAPIFKEAGFTRVQFTGITGTFEQNIRAVEKTISELDVERESLLQEQASMVSILPDLHIAYDIEIAQRDRHYAAQRLLTTSSAFMLSGWIPAAQQQSVEEEVKRIAPDAVIAFADPQEDENPPVLMKNGWFASQFEGIVKMFSLPDPRGLDPSAVMAPFFIIFFGMMVSDAGYGIVLTIAATLMVILLKPRDGTKKIALIMAMGGGATLFWGAMFGGWFGIETKPILFVPMNEPLLMLGLCFGLGFLHLIVGLFVGIYMNIKRGKPLAALFDQGFWLLLICGLPMLALPATASVGKVLSLVGTIGIILTAGRDKPGNILKKMLSGLGALYNISGYLSDVLSYARLFGMGLATGVIGMVINTVAAMLMTNAVGVIAGIVVLIGGHLFNMAINVLGAYVHACRLQFIEFFGKFYESGGVAFKPLNIQSKYVDFQDGTLS